MARYVMTEMARGVSPDGKRVVSEANLLERRKPRIAMGDGEHYGLGLVVGSYRDLPVLDHAGGTFGFRTLMFMLPEQGIAVVVLTNTTGAGGDFTDVVQRKVMEALFEGAEERARRPQLDVHVNARRERIAETCWSSRRWPAARSPSPATTRTPR